MDDLGGTDPVICSAKGCRASARHVLVWNNPKVHAPDREKTWVACDAHREPLAQHLEVRGFLQRVDALAPDPLAPDPLAPVVQDAARPAAHPLQPGPGSATCPACGARFPPAQQSCPVCAGLRTGSCGSRD